jgi:hypothetical protein
MKFPQRAILTDRPLSIITKTASSFSPKSTTYKGDFAVATDAGIAPTRQNTTEAVKPLPIHLLHQRPNCKIAL